MKKELKQRILDTTLTKTEKKVAEYLLENSSKICFMSLSEVAGALSTSDTSVIRCCRSLGYKGFSDLQHELQEEISSMVHDQSGMLGVVDRYEASRHKAAGESGTLHALVASLQESVNATIERNREEHFLAAADLIAAAKRKYIVGFRGCSSPAYHFSRLLRYLCSDVVELTHTDRIVHERLLDLERDDVVVIFCLPRYGKTDLSIHQMAQERGAKVIVITDKAVCEVAQGADIVLLLDIRGISFFHSHFSSMFVMEYLLTLIANKQGPLLKDRIEELNKYYINPPTEELY